MRFHLGLSSKARRLFSSSPAMNNPPNGENPVANLDSEMTFSDRGSNADTFFETRPWLDSDCDDDFFSVNGEFTPSRGSTPVHHFAAGRTSSLNSSVTNNKLELSSSVDERQMTSSDQKPKATDGNGENCADDEEEGVDDRATRPPEGSPLPDAADADAAATAHGKAKPERQSRYNSAGCCFPGLGLGLSERKIKKMIPEHASG